MSKSIPQTQNEGWGFYGTMGGHAESAWPQAMTIIANELGESLEAVRWFLDSRYGRHFADAVRNEMHDGLALGDAIQAATKKWSEQRIRRSTCRHYRIPYKHTTLASYVAEYHVSGED